jgi:hypothetical protein
MRASSWLAIHCLAPYFSFSCPAPARPPPRQRGIAQPPRRQPRPHGLFSTPRAQALRISKGEGWVLEAARCSRPWWRRAGGGSRGSRGMAGALHMRQFVQFLVATGAHGATTALTLSSVRTARVCAPAAPAWSPSPARPIYVHHGHCPPPFHARRDPCIAPIPGYPAAHPSHCQRPHLHPPPRPAHKYPVYHVPSYVLLRPAPLPRRPRRPRPPRLSPDRPPAVLRPARPGRLPERARGPMDRRPPPRARGHPGMARRQARPRSPAPQAPDHPRRP